jgi:hypothetical protein
MTVERTHTGAWRICAIIRGHQVTRTYYGFTKWEAKKEFCKATK